MSLHQQRFGKEPTAEANRLLAITEIERLDREASENPPPAQASVPESEFDKPDLEVTPDDKPFFKPIEGRAERLMRRMMRRVELLMEKRDTGPLGQASWSQRVQSVLYWRMKSARLWKAGRYDEANDLEHRYMKELKDLLNASSATFGEWNADPAPLIMVG